MVMVRLRGVHVLRVKLAGGRRAEYHYAWRGKGAPRLPGAPGSPEYVAAYEEAHSARRRPQTGTFRQIIVGFRGSPEFTRLGVHTQRAYRAHLDTIEKRWGDMPLKALDDPDVRKHFLRWRDSMAASPRAADYAVGTLKRLLKWAVERVEITTNQAAPISRLHSADKSDDIWTAADFAAFVGVASPELRWAASLAAHTGLRQSDLIRVAWGHYDGESFSLRTSKRGRQVLIPATHNCRALMQTIERRGPIVLTTARTKRPWTADGLRSSFRKACIDAKIKRTFHDLRRTAATNILCAGFEASQVAMMMGWSEADVEVLKRKYVSRAAVVQAALAKLERAD
jgi:integrase